MNGATVQANVLVALPLNRLRVLVYCTVAVTVVLTAAAGFLVYERIVEDVEASLPALENTTQTTVSFFARAYTIDDIEPWETVIFPRVGNNIGGAYNSTSGSFVAPISGTYAFFCNIISQRDSAIELAFQVNGVIKLVIYSAGGKGFGTGSNMLVVDLEADDIVKVVKHGTWGTQPFYVHQTGSSFSGFLLFKAS